MATTVSLINMKGGVGKTTLAFSFAYHCAYYADLKVLAVDLDPQSNLSQYFMGAEAYLQYVEANRGTVVDIFEQFSSPNLSQGDRSRLDTTPVVKEIINWDDGSLIHLIPARLELSWVLKNPTDKSHLLSQYIDGIKHNYDIVIIDCAPTESILTTAAYMCSEYVIVPIRPDFLATIGLPLLARSLDEHRRRHNNQDIKIAGIVFNDVPRRNITSDQSLSMIEIRATALKYGWPVFERINLNTASLPKGSRKSTPIFQTKHAKTYVKNQMAALGNEFLGAIDLL